MNSQRGYTTTNKTPITLAELEANHPTNQHVKELEYALIRANERLGTLKQTEKRLAEAERLLSSLLEWYGPTWHYQTSKTGYECNFCRVVVRRGNDFENPAHHRDDCVLMEAKKYAKEHEL